MAGGAVLPSKDETRREVEQLDGEIVELDERIVRLKEGIYQREHNAAAVHDYDIDIPVPRDHGKIGISVKPTKKGNLLITKVLAAGFIPDWNVTNPARRVEPGDVIANINGVTGDKAMIAEMKKGQDFNVRVKKVERFEVVVHKHAAKKWGIRFDSVPEHDGAYLVSVHEGDNVVHDHNTTNPTTQIRATDWFVSVNGKTKYKEIIADLGQEGQKSIVVKRGFWDYKAGK